MIISTVRFKVPHKSPIIDLGSASVVFTDVFISDAFHLIVDRLLPLSAQDWQSWQDDPEEWFVNQMDVGLAWSYDFRVSLLKMIIAHDLSAPNLSPARREFLCP